MSEAKMNLLELELGSKLIIEAGHIYTNETPGLEQMLGVQIGSAIAEAAVSSGCEVEKWLFIDNYNSQFQDKPEVLDETAYLQQLAQWGFAPDKILYEADLVGQAQHILDKLKSEKYAGDAYAGGKVVLYKGKILLYDKKKGVYSCSLLDACLYLEKLEKADEAITVLDLQFKPQQKATMKILKKLGEDTSKIEPVYYHTPGGIHHDSVDPSRVYVGQNRNITPVSANIVQMMKLMSIMMHQSGTNLPPTLEVMKYVC